MRTLLALLALTLLFQGCGHGGSGGHHDHDFKGAEKWAERFDDPARDEWQKPDAVIAKLKLTEKMRVADLGSGTGYFAVRLARALPGGFVYGIDTERDMVRYLNERAAREGLSKNLKSSLGTNVDAQLPEAVDLVLLVNTYHHIQNRIRYFKRLSLKLNERGRVAIVDFKEGELPFGPPPGMRVAPKEVVKEMEAAGFRLIESDEKTLPYQAIMLFELPAIRFSRDRR